MTEHLDAAPCGEHRHPINRDDERSTMSIHNTIDDNIEDPPATFLTRHAVSTVIFVLGLCLGFIAGIGTILIVDEAVGLDQPKVVQPAPASLSSTMRI